MGIRDRSSALGKLYEYPGIPTYFVIDREGKLSYKVTGFPGAEVMKEELLKAGSRSSRTKDSSLQISYARNR